MNGQTITSAERDRLANYLAESEQRLLRVTRDLTPRQLDDQPAPDRWSVGDCLEHLAVAETRVLGRIEKALQEPPDAAKRSAWEGRDEDLVRAVADRRSRVQAPEPLRPAHRWSHARSFQAAARQRTAAFVATTSKPLRAYLVPHPLFGEIDCYQLLLATAAHCDRHRAQCEEIIAAPGFPRA